MERRQLTWWWQGEFFFADATRKGKRCHVVLFSYFLRLYCPHSIFGFVSITNPVAMIHPDAESVQLPCCNELRNWCYSSSSLQLLWGHFQNWMFEHVLASFASFFDFPPLILLLLLLGLDCDFLPLHGIDLGNRFLFLQCAQSLCRGCYDDWSKTLGSEPPRGQDNKLLYCSVSFFPAPTFFSKRNLVMK